MAAVMLRDTNLAAGLAKQLGVRGVRRPREAAERTSTQMQVELGLARPNHEAQGVCQRRR